jgi:hypothetical protein
MKKLNEFGEYYENLKVGDYFSLNVKDFKKFWDVQYGAVLTEIHNEVFKLFLKKYKGDFRLTADELNEFCTRYDDPKGENGVRGGYTREQEIEGDLWI